MCVSLQLEDIAFCYDRAQEFVSCFSGEPLELVKSRANGAVLLSMVNWNNNHFFSMFNSEQSLLLLSFVRSKYLLLTMYLRDATWTPQFDFICVKQYL